MEASEAPPDWSGHRDVPLLHTLATAVLALAETTGLERFRLPYHPEAQRALDQTALSCLRRGAKPPASLPQLVHWCRTRPIARWGLDLPRDAFGPRDLLVDRNSAQPTELCHEWAMDTQHSAALHRDREVIGWAMRVCRDIGAPESYTAFRRLLVTRPVLTRMDSFEISVDTYLEPVRTLIDDIYQQVPASYRRDGNYVACGRCLTLLVPLADGGWWCERDQCRREGPPPVGQELAATDVEPLRQLERPLRQFVTGPGRAEVALEAELTGLGLLVEMWPGFDAYDLRVTFPDGWVWAADVKDWAHPGLLGRHARAVRRQPPYDKAFWVVPQHRVDSRPDYLDVYARHRPPEAADLPLLTDRRLVAAAAARLRNPHNEGDSDA
ncbi:hypothetical protein OHA71_32860 [Streptomyces sp. NBC_00444]|uniref:pPIWI_RE_Y domain-containing protein n=1 Tax=Streptomyces sp. NBC_00444 TaxID=2975744 RepID=UPI002E202848